MFDDGLEWFFTSWRSRRVHNASDVSDNYETVVYVITYTVTHGQTDFAVDVIIKMISIQHGVIFAFKMTRAITTKFMFTSSRTQWQTDISVDVAIQSMCMASVHLLLYHQCRQQC